MHQAFNYKELFRYMSEHRCSDPLCGYIRGIEMDTKGRVYGRCALNNNACGMNILPQSELECKVALAFFKKLELFGR